MATRESETTLRAKFAAQRLAFGPIMFQAARVLRNSGMLAAIQEAGTRGLSIEEAAKAAGVPVYGATVLLEAGEAADLVLRRPNDHFALTKTGYFVQNDELTRVNMDFTHDVCYRGMFRLEEAIHEERPAGLEAFGAWSTVYEALAQLPPEVQKSWFGFDHYYSDGAFPDALPVVFSNPPRRLMDVGGNTGRFARACVAHDPNVEVTIVDLPGQIATAMQALSEDGLTDRIHGHAVDLLDETQALPEGFDALWMSQFLCCFSPDQIVSLLRRARQAIGSAGVLYIMDTYWDRQRYEAATYSLKASSLYFTCLANGNSRMYDAKTMRRCVEQADLQIREEIDGLGMSHTIFVCAR